MDEITKEKAIFNYTGKKVLYKIDNNNGTEYFKLVCPRCHKEIDRDDRFCKKCGIRLLYK